MKEYENFSGLTSFQVATESYSFHCASNKDVLIIFVPFSSSVKCAFKKKWRKQ